MANGCRVRHSPRCRRLGGLLRWRRRGHGRRPEESPRSGGALIERDRLGVDVDVAVCGARVVRRRPEPQRDLGAGCTWLALRTLLALCALFALGALLSLEPTGWTMS